MVPDFPQVVEARHVGGYRVFVVFRDRNSGEVNLESELYGEVFTPLKDEEYFRRFVVHPELHTLVWPNGADFAPEFLYRLAFIAAAH